MDSISKAGVDAPFAEHVQYSSDGKVGDNTDEKIVPIDEEAVQDAHHIDLSWRSWVRTYSAARAGSCL